VGPFASRRFTSTISIIYLAFTKPRNPCGMARSFAIGQHLHPGTWCAMADSSSDDARVHPCKPCVLSVQTTFSRDKGESNGRPYGVSAGVWRTKPELPSLRR